MPLFMEGWGTNRHRLVVSLCDYSGNWPRPWNTEGGYSVICFDLKRGDDVLDVERIVARIASTCIVLGPTAYVDTILAAPVCTVFTVSGARWWKGHDASGRTAEGLRLVDACLELIHRYRPSLWALENPVGRLPTLRPILGKPGFYFHPHQYARWAPDPESERYTKRTGIWTNGRKPTDAPLDPIMYTTRDGKRGSWQWATLGGKSERTKELRSITPLGFSRAFYHANARTVDSVSSAA